MRLLIYPAKWPLQCDILYFQKINVVIFVWRTTLCVLCHECVALVTAVQAKTNFNQG